MFSYPGVYIREVPSGVRTIAGVSTSIAAFVGMIQRGPLNVPTNVLNFTDYTRAFGSDTTISEMTDQVRLFFQNGGQNAYIMRIANGAQRAQITVTNEFNQDVISFVARDHGVLGENIRLRVDYDTDQPEATFNLTIFREVVVNGNIQFENIEIHRNLSMNPLSGRFVNTVLDQESSLLTVLTEDNREESDLSLPIPPEPIQGYAIAGVLLSTSDDIERITTAIGNANPGAATGSFEISVDGSSFEIVTLTEDINTAADIESAINLALDQLGSVTVRTDIEVTGSGPAFWAIISNSANGGSVRIRRAANNDIAGALGLGTDNGGLEVDGYAVQRPAPTGFFSRLGFNTLDIVNNSATALGALSQFLQATSTELATITVADVNSPIVNGTRTGNNTAPNYEGNPMWSGSATTDQSLLNGGGNLNSIVEAINNDDSIRWTARQSGYRIFLVPDFGNADSDITATITSAAPDAAIGDTTTGIFGISANVERYRLGSYDPLDNFNYVTGFRSGNDGSTPQLADYDAAYEVINSEVDIFNLLILPRALFTDPRQDDEARAALWGPASIFCQSQRAFLLIDPRSDWRTVQQVSNGVVALRVGGAGDHEAVYWPRLRIIDPANGLPRIVDPAGSIAGVMARTDSNRGVWKAPAGLEADIRGIRGIEYNISDPENGLINLEAVNAIRAFPIGIVSWGARTIDGFNENSNIDSRYVPVRRIALFIEESLYRGLQFAVFEPNDEPLWAQIRLAAGAFMNNLFRQGAFQGQKASDAYLVKVDSETTTQNDINLGIVNVVIGFAPLRPAEFVVVTIQQLAGQVQV